ncbi:MAG: ABC transporter substrate-binding protein [Treponema sp.]|jgi:ABC-type glycerol-3-phosphate transport system substrate-binding protein|nr:ABC transporter substrate-binding protein [Treponema sp.]
MKKMVMIVLACLIAVSAFAGGSKAPGASPAGGFKAAGIYEKYDLTQSKTIYVYMVGDPAKDIDEIMGMANNQYFKPLLNTEVILTFISWAELADKYPLVLASGEDVDIIHAAPWNNYEQEAAKGSFRALTDQFIQEWMPATWVSQPRISWYQARSGGKVYAVPAADINVEYKFPVIRDDLRTKYSLPELKNWNDLRNYVYTIASRETGIQAYAAPASTIELMWTYLEAQNVKWSSGPIYYVWDMGNKKEARPDDLYFLYNSPWYKQYALEMADWAAHNVWSRNVMNNTIPQRDSFVQGRSASMYWNGSVFDAGKEMAGNGVGTPGYYDLSPATPTSAEVYSNNMFAITSASKNAERAALVLDLMKNNLQLQNLLMAGVEGRHYILTGANEAIDGPEAADYPWDNWTWALRNPKRIGRAYSPDTDPRRIEMENAFTAKLWEPLMDGFRVDSTTFSTEWTVISSLIEEYNNSFQCGVFGSQTSAKYDEFTAKLKAAGIDKVTQAFKAQYTAFLAEVQSN